jgi:long-chain acyl-CoA synthetase
MSSTPGTALGKDEALAALTGPGSVYEIAETDHDGVPWRIFPRGPRTLREAFLATAAYGDREALVSGPVRITYAGQQRLVAHLARHLAVRHGVRSGDRVAIAMRNHPEFVLSFWAVQLLGAVAVPLNAWWTADELRYGLTDCEAVVLIADGERAKLLDGRLDDLPVRALLVAHPSGDCAGEDLTAFLAAAEGPCEPPAGDPDPDDPAVLMYTSGTTGRPKGAVGTHRNHCTNLHTMHLSQAVQLLGMGMPAELLTGGPVKLFEALPDLPQSSALQCYPLFHIAGLSGMYVTAGGGGKMTLMHRWDTDEVLRTIEREKITSATMVPTLLRRLLESPNRSKHDLSSLLMLGAGGAPVPPDLVGEVGRMSGEAISPLNGYGMTETTCVATANTGADYYAHPDSVGLPVPVIDLRIADPVTGEEVPAGELGEVWFRGPHIVAGYWRRPEETREAFPDGWFRTGDLGHRDADGYLYVVDRLKDVVIRGGENVYSAEVEAVLFEHEAVADVAIVGVPHRDLGEEVAAVVELQPGAVCTAAELRGHVAKRLAAFKVPTIVRFTQVPLPRNAVGKVLKRQLRDLLTG